ncbi:LysR family transcriptional regulator [Marinobacter nanhaiticus D15-8W]|uniref:LysR family transcriptional regulator n=1 Tax=Marinobacter nanhaiticus D15-8W TaxID=626887 RepID=N6WS98_9GAMM|nr:LysR family transcriptional regulator [Marinobacter nanhaiticus]ENO14426.1 LysR family transcriptional regulator [Marinobacter nanhaiticus D15-8W]BES71816.1 LysR family transcriptional regulator [Marinobacter nanhaiticus D15-8W]
MDWGLLPDFLMIVRAHSLTGAADRLGVNHSTIYRRLNQLEAQLNCRLFERLNTGYRLTPEGEALLSHAEAMEAEAFHAERLLGGADVTLQGEVRLTAPENLVYDFLPDYLERFQQQYPDIRVSVLVTNTDLDLNRREADLALRATPSPPDYLVGRKLTDIGWAVFGAPKLIEVKGEPVDLKAACDYPWVGPEAALMHIPGYRWVVSQVPEKLIVIRGSTLNAIARFAQAGLGLAALPMDQVRQELKPVLALSTTPLSGLWLLTHADLRNVARIRVLMDFLADAFREDPRWPSFRGFSST